MRKVFARRFVQGFCIVVLVLAIIKEVAPAVAYTDEERAQAKERAVSEKSVKAQHSFKAKAEGKAAKKENGVNPNSKVQSKQGKENGANSKAQSKQGKVSGVNSNSNSNSKSKSKVKTTDAAKVRANGGGKINSNFKVKSTDAAKAPHRIYSVPGYDRCFADGNDVQLASAVKYGVEPIANREEAEARKDELVYIGANPYFVVEEARSSIPYLVPRASTLLQDIGKTFFDSLQIKGIPLHKMIITSVLRTQDDVERLQRHNTNAVPNSCHQYATTFDICYNRYCTVAPPGEERRAVRNDTLKWVLSEVLYDMKKQGRCYVKHEKKQGCFHITVR
ncbi:MAG: DUF5715 family protein [Prevotella sp.]|nr:DUF5715 family protein [Prevotella sp.]